MELTRDYICNQKWAVITDPDTHDLENKNNDYYYTSDQVDKIFTTIEDKLKHVKERFNNAGKEKEIDFEL